MAEEYDPIESVLDKAMEYASERNHEYVVLEHLLLALANEKEIQSLIVEVKGDIDQIMIDYFGTNTPIKQLANISVTDASTISLSIWDKNAVSLIEKALNESNLGVNPTVNGTNLHIKFPPLTQERREELKKIVKKKDISLPPIVDANRKGMALS